MALPHTLSFRQHTLFSPPPASLARSDAMETLIAGRSDRALSCSYRALSPGVQPLQLLTPDPPLSSSHKSLPPSFHRSIPGFSGAGDETSPSGEEISENVAEEENKRGVCDVQPASVTGRESALCVRKQALLLGPRGRSAFWVTNAVAGC